jgi:hypothetical protein
MTSQQQQPKYGLECHQELAPHGPFDTKEACIVHAKQHLNIDDSLTLPGIPFQRQTIQIGKVSYLKPEDFVYDLFPTILDHMEAEADCTYSLETKVFISKSNAQEALQEVLQIWARNYITIDTHSKGWELKDLEDYTF